MRNTKKKEAGIKSKRAKAHVQGGTYPAGVAKRRDGRTGDHPCLCGCGRRVRRFFSQGHDQRVRALLQVKVEDRTAKLSALLRSAIARGLVLNEARGGRVLSAKA